MRRREFLKTATAMGAACVAGGSMAAGADRPRKPNIVLIMADDLGWAELGCYGQKKIRTPNIDALAAAGMRFTQFYSGSAVCAPSRCCLMTGRHGGRAYIRDNGEIKDPDPSVFGGQTPLAASEPTIAKTLKAAGYATGCFGKWGLGRAGSEGDPLNQGFDRFYGYNCQRHAHNLYPRYLVSDCENMPLPGNTGKGPTGQTYAPQCIADEALKFVRANKDRPFFLYYPTVIPHLALQVPDADLAQYKGKWPETPYTGKAYQPHPTPRACYAAMISFLDRQVGRLVALLKELGLADNTVILFTSDNGTTHLGDEVDYEFFQSVGPLRGLKGSLYEGGIRVPLVAHWPGRIAPGATSDLPGVNYDLAATLAEIAGVEYAKGTDGVSILPTLLGQAERQKKHEFLFWDFGGYGGQTAVRMGRWKGVRKNTRRKADAPLEVYDLEADVGESKDQAADRPEIAKQLEAVIRRERLQPVLEKFRFGTYAG